MRAELSNTHRLGRKGSILRARQKGIQMMVPGSPQVEQHTLQMRSGQGQRWTMLTTGFRDKAVKSHRFKSFAVSGESGNSQECQRRKKEMGPLLAEYWGQ